MMGSRGADSGSGVREKLVAGIGGLVTGLEERIKAGLGSVLEGRVAVEGIEEIFLFLKEGAKKGFYMDGGSGVKEKGEVIGMLED